MRLVLVVVRDRSADVFGRPTFTTSVGVAIRSFSDEVNRAAEDNVMYRHPEDFDLYELGVYDDETGTFDVHQPRQIAIGKDVSRK